MKTLAERVTDLEVSLAAEQKKSRRSERLLFTLLQKLSERGSFDAASAMAVLDKWEAERPTNQELSTLGL